MPGVNPKKTGINLFELFRMELRSSFTSWTSTTRSRSRSWPTSWRRPTEALTCSSTTLVSCSRMIVNCRVHLRYYFKWPVEAYLKGRQPFSRACVVFNSNKTLISFLLDPNSFCYPWVIAQLPNKLHMNLLRIEVYCLDAHAKKIIVLWGIDVMY